MIEALGHRVTIRPDKPEDAEANKTLARAKTSGLVIPEKVEENLRSETLREQAAVDQGYVLTIGKTAFRDFGGDPWCKVGDYVAYARHAGKFVKDPDTDEYILVLNDEDIICLITKEKV